MFEWLTSSENIIEGVGNEVTLLVACIVVTISVILSWRSTHVHQYDQHQHTHYHGATTTSQQRDSASGSSTNTSTTTTQQSSETNTSTNVTSEDQQQSSSNSQSSASDNQSNTEQPSTSSAEPEDSTPPSEPGEQFSLRLKFLDDTQQLIQCSNRDKIRDLRHNFPSETAHRYRLIFAGQVLRDDRTLEQYGIRRQLDSDNSEIIPVIHCFLSNAPEPSPQQQQQQNSTPNSATEQIQQNVGDLHIGQFFLPLLGSMLMMLWYICIFHTNLFTVPSIFGIVGLTCFYAIVLVNRFI